MTKLNKVEATIYVEELNGKAILCLTPEREGNRRFSFGVEKARLILKHMEMIERFVNTYPDGEYFDLY